MTLLRTGKASLIYWVIRKESGPHLFTLAKVCLKHQKGYGGLKTYFLLFQGCTGTKENLRFHILSHSCTVTVAFGCIVKQETVALVVLIRKREGRIKDAAPLGAGERVWNMTQK